MRIRQKTVWVFVIVVSIVLFRVVQAEDPKQVVVSATPIPINIPSPLPFVTQAIEVSATATRTPTPRGAVLLEALTEANVRAQPDTEAERLGSIRAGDVYPVIGRYFRWYQFQYEQSPSGTGWVFDELVRIIGDETTITDLNEGAVPTIDPIILAETATWEAITQTPGGILTATASSGQIPLPIPPGQGGADVIPEDIGVAGVLPTYTFPPNIVALAPPEITQEVSGNQIETTEDIIEFDNITLSTNIPPITPILLLGGLGIIGLFISSFRR